MSQRIIEIVGPVGETAEPRIPLAEGVEGNFNGVMAHRPDLMAGFFELYLTLWTGGVLDMRVKDLCRMAIARSVGCRICQNTRFTCALPHVDEADYLPIDDPGASDALTHGCVFSPRSTAFFATSPAASITDGLLVFVQLVIAAITTDPCSTAACGGDASAAPPPPPADVFPRATIMPGSACANPCFAVLSGTRSWGRFGPARLGSIASSLKSMVSEYDGSAAPFSKNSPCARAYASTSSTRA